MFAYPRCVFQMNNSTENQVVLKSVNLSSTGRYRCEVSAEAPSFQTVSDHGDMVVVGKPKYAFTLLGFTLASSKTWSSARMSLCSFSCVKDDVLIPAEPVVSVTEFCTF